jgi:hypothetical protein
MFGIWEHTYVLKVEHKRQGGFILSSSEYSTESEPTFVLRLYKCSRGTNRFRFWTVGALDPL